jgi:excisionase family DNA binding protein
MLNTRQNQQANIVPIRGIDFKFFYVSEVAAMLRVGSPIIYKLIHEGKLDAVKIGRAWKISEAAITHYIGALGNHRD